MPNLEFLQFVAFALGMVVFGFAVAAILEYLNVPKTPKGQFFVGLLFLAGLGFLAYWYDGERNLALVIAGFSIFGYLIKSGRSWLARVQAEQDLLDRELELQAEASRTAEVIVIPYYANNEDCRGQIMDIRGV
jgi:hypothetical protein